MTANILKSLQEGLSRDALAFLPELILCGAIVLMLLIRLVPRFDRKHLGWVALVLTVYALVVSVGQGFWYTGTYDPRQWEQTVSEKRAANADLDFLTGPADLTAQPTTPLALSMFNGLLVYDNFTIYIRIFLLSFTALTILLTLMTRVPDIEDSADFYCLLLGAVVGMSVMASSNHLLMVLLGIEMASLPSYALAGFLKGKRNSSEAALKYVVYGGGAAGVMLYGMSLLAGRYGTAYIPDLARMMSETAPDPLVILGTLFIFVGVLFKLAAVPFHFWCPDVFEGAAAEVGAFLSVASKGAALGLLARFILALTGLGAIDPDPALWHRTAPYLVPTLAILAAVTTTFGNLAAYGQTNLKRLLAYSTIAHAGFMMMGLCTLTPVGVGAVLFYLVAYLLMNLGAFAVVAFLRNLTGSEELADFRGLIHRNPVLVITLGVFLLSLLGLPPLVGFAAKFQIFAALFQGAREFADQQQTGLSYTLYALVVIGGLNTALALFYYVKVLKVMVLDAPLEVVENRPVEPLTTPPIPNAYLIVLATLILVTGILWDPIAETCLEQGVNSFERPVAQAPAPTRTAQGAP